MRIKFLIQNLLKDPFLVFTNEEILKLGKDLNFILEILTVNKLKDTFEKHLDKKSSEELLEKIKLNSSITKFSIPKIKELLLNLQNSNFNDLTEKEYFSFEDILERVYKKINLSKNKELIRELEEQVPVPLRELYNQESSLIPEITFNQNEEIQEKIVEQTKKLVSDTLKKAAKYKIIFSKLKTVPEKNSIAFLNKLSKKEKQEISHLANLTKNDENGKVTIYLLSEKNTSIWLETFIKSKKNISIFDVLK